MFLHTVALDSLHKRPAKGSKKALVANAIHEEKSTSSKIQTQCTAQHRIKPQKVTVDESVLQMIRSHTYVDGEIIWGKMKGFPLWPAKVRIDS